MIALGTKSKFKNIPDLTSQEEDYLNRIMKFSLTIDVIIILFGISALIMNEMIFSNLQLINPSLTQLFQILDIPIIYAMWYYGSKSVFYQKFTNVSLLDCLFEKAEINKLKKKNAK